MLRVNSLHTRGELTEEEMNKKNSVRISLYIHPVCFGPLSVKSSVSNYMYMYSVSGELTHAIAVSIPAEGSFLHGVTQSDCLDQTA